MYTKPPELCRAWLNNRYLQGLRWLKRWNISKGFLSREFDEEKIYKDVFRKGFLNFLKYKVWGINRRKFHTIPTEKIQELKNKIEPLFRISEVYLKENNINNFKLSLEIISNITRLYSEKYNNFSETNYYFFVAGKLKQLFEIAIKLNYQSFPECIVEINEKICLSVIRKKKSDAELFNNNQTASVGAFKTNAKDFIAMSINLDNTPAPALAITTLGRVFSKLLFNNSLDEARVLLPEEEKTLLEASEGCYIKPILICALHTGMRSSEIKSLKWSCVNFEEGYIDVLKTKSGRPRQIPLSDSLMDELNKIKKLSGYVFTNPKTLKPYTNIRDKFTDLCEKNGIDSIRFHDLRHTAATRMVASGIDIVVVQDILGHANLSVTQRYSHPVPDRKKKAIEALNNYCVNEEEVA